MTKEELYNKILSVYQRTGQGTSGKILTEYKNEVDELLDDGLIELCKHPRLPNEKWFCLTGVYSTEDDPDDLSLTYMRFYRGLEKVTGVNFKFNSDELRKDIYFLGKYSQWLTKNKEMLEKGDNLKKVYNFSPNKELISWVKKRSWFAENESIEICLDKSEQLEQIYTETINLYSDLLILQIQQKDFTGIKESSIQVKEATLELKLVKSLVNWLKTQDFTKKIQEVL